MFYKAFFSQFFNLIIYNFTLLILYFVGKLRQFFDVFTSVVFVMNHQNQSSFFICCLCKHANKYMENF